MLNRTELPNCFTLRAGCILLNLKHSQYRTWTGGVDYCFVISEKKKAFLGYGQDYPKVSAKNTTEVFLPTDNKSHLEFVIL